MVNLEERTQDFLRELGLRRVVDLVAGAVEDDRGVVAVAADGVARVDQRPVVEITGVVVRLLGHGPGVEKLVQHEEAHPVAQVEELGGDGVVRGADGVDAELLQLRQPLLPHPSGTATPKAPPS